MEMEQRQEEKYKPAEGASESESWGGKIPDKLRWNLNTVPSFSTSRTWSANNRHPVAAREAAESDSDLSLAIKKKKVHRRRIIR